MSAALDALLALLDLEPLEVNIYRGQNRDLGTGRVYGGQVFAQALVAARRTVEGDREAHSAPCPPRLPHSTRSSWFASAERCPH